MGKTRRKIDERSSPTHSSHSSSSQSDFEFLISLPSPNKLSSSSCPAADELFFKGQILPLHISPRLSMLQSLGPSSSYSSSTTTSSSSSSRDSTSSSNDLFLLSNESSCNSSTRPSSVTEELVLLPHHDLNQKFTKNHHQVLSFDQNLYQKQQIKKPIKYFSLSRFSNVFRKDHSTKKRDTTTTSTTTPVIQEQGMMSNSNSVKKMKDMVSKYMKKVKPFYEKLSSSSNKQQSSSIKDRGLTQSQSFSENILYPRKNNNKCIVSSCPSSMRSSPSRSLIKSSSSSIEELQNAIQGAIAHCKNSYSKSSDF